MAQIKLGGKYAVGDQRFVVVDDENYEKLKGFSWRARKGRNTFYAVRSESITVGEKKKNMQVQMHRQILGLHHGQSIEVDHINRNGLDNRRANLRLATKSVNQRNRIHRLQKGVCVVCGKEYELFRRAAKPRKYCSVRCQGLASDWLTTESGKSKAAVLIGALSATMGTLEISEKSGLNRVSVWRLLPQLIRAGEVQLVSESPHLYERSNSKRQSA